MSLNVDATSGAGQLLVAEPEYVGVLVYVSVCDIHEVIALIKMEGTSQALKGSFLSSFFDENFDVFSGPSEDRCDFAEHKIFKKE